jgi:hypothetical protein
MDKEPQLFYVYLENPINHFWFCNCLLSVICTHVLLLIVRVTVSDGDVCLSLCGAGFATPISSRCCIL